MEKWQIWFQWILILLRAAASRSSGNPCSNQYSDSQLLAYRNRRSHKNADPLLWRRQYWNCIKLATRPGPSLHISKVHFKRHTRRILTQHSISQGLH